MHGVGIELLSAWSCKPGPQEILLVWASGLAIVVGILAGAMYFRRRVPEKHNDFDFPCGIPLRPQTGGYQLQKTIANTTWVTSFGMVKVAPLGFIF